ncbi:MAG: hypothetical protein OEW84_04860 [Aigarchaeota archaeon]|nr:hypothetical protein [Aigarchaeota archaeon]
MYSVKIADNKNWTETVLVDTTIPGIANPTVVFDCTAHEEVPPGQQQPSGTPPAPQVAHYRSKT